MSVPVPVVSGVMVVVVVFVVESAVVLLSELSLQATRVPAIANTAKNFFMILNCFFVL